MTAFIGMGSDAKIYGVSFGDEQDVLKLTVMTAVQLSEHTKNHRIIYFSWVNCILCGLYLNKTVFKKVNHYK